MFYDSPLLKVRDVLLRCYDRLNAHDLAVLDQVEDEAVVVKYRIRGAWVFLQLLLPGFVLFIEHTIGLSFESPLVDNIFIELLFLQWRLDFVVVEPEVFE